MTTYKNAIVYTIMCLYKYRVSINSYRIASLFVYALG